MVGHPFSLYFDSGCIFIWQSSPSMAAAAAGTTATDGGGAGEAAKAGQAEGAGRTAASAVGWWGSSGGQVLGSC